MDMDIEQAPLNIDSLKDALVALEDTIAEYDECELNSNCNTRRLRALRSGVIHNFEVAYELCWKYMKKWLEMNISPDIVKGVTRKEFYRIAWENGLITDVKEWWGFHDIRNRTGHIYSETVAEQVFKAAVKFIATAKTFAAVLESVI